MNGPPPHALADYLRQHPAIRSKLSIPRAAGTLGLTAASSGGPGDDAVMIPTPDRFDLLAGEGFIPAFVQSDPWFAGWCGVMVNLSDIAAMGGRATALIDMVWAPEEARAHPLLTGLRDAAAACDVPLVGGHTNFSARELNLAVSVLGRAVAPVTSFDATAGDVVVAAMDHRGQSVNFDNLCAALNAPHARLRNDLALLPQLAEAGVLTTGKDISQGGIAGTALMLAECSYVAITLNLDRITPPVGIGPQRWMCSFPSFGFLLTARAQNADRVCAAFRARDIWTGRIGTVAEGSRVTFRQVQSTALFWDYAQSP